jgi:3-hydroxyisobutyrate dehydrogenase
MGSVQIAGAAEGLLIAEKAGLDLETVAYALSKGAASSPQVIRNSQRMVEGNHDENVVFSGRWRLKDTLYGLKLAESVGQEARFGGVAGKIYRQLVDEGLGDVNETKVIDVLRS